jgi:uncharacterized LabA/DUF88 family protein
VKKLESVCAEVPTLPKVPGQPHNTGYIIDGMTIIQSLNESFFKTLDDLAETSPSHQITGAHEVLSYRLFMKGLTNKAALSAFVCKSIAASAPALKEQNKAIILAGGIANDKTIKLIKNSRVVMMPHLFSTQEEADTRIVLHAIDLAYTHPRVIVCCDDTDVLVLLLYYYG